jgi:3,4-dihydroxy-9,10-secoandrosta-1,3,5(10)-triene-9,17-dione 4,5-dioxygenase
MIKNLAYIGFTSPAAEDWRSFGPDVLGAELAPEGPDGAVRLRVDDIGTALDLVNEREMRLAMTLGRHTNDLMTSFYVRTPSGFEIEYGTGGLLVDDDSWEAGILAPVES